MRLSRLEIQNYKSLRDVVIEPGPLSVFVGANATGKTNFTDAIDFLGDVYRLGLEDAVSRKGGYENICYRNTRRSKAGLRFRVVLQGHRDGLWIDRTGELSAGLHDVTLDHTFEFRTKSQGIEAPFAVSAESISVSITADGKPGGALTIANKNGRLDLKIDHGFTPNSTPLALLQADLNMLALEPENYSSELILSVIKSRLSWFGDVAGGLSSAKVFQLSPQQCRESGVPIPNPHLDRFGDNLAGVIQYFKKQHNREYIRLLETMTNVMPSIEDIVIDFTHTKRLGLFIKERGFSRPWAADDVSDGTIQAIGLLAAIFDPRTDLAVVEEPENSVHPWAIRHIVQAARTASLSKQIFFTTHSPVVIDQLKPEELWVVQRPRAGTRIDPVLKLDPSLGESWVRGKFALSEYLDSGAVPEAVPAFHP